MGIQDFGHLCLGALYIHQISILTCTMYIACLGNIWYMCMGINKLLHVLALAVSEILGPFVAPSLSQHY